LRAFQEGNSCLLSPGASDSPVRISFLLWRSRPLAPGSCWRTGHCPVHTGQSSAPSRPLARPRVSRGSRSRPLAYRTVRCTPDSPVNYSRTPPMKSREQRVRKSQPGAPDTVRCTTEHCLVHHRTVRCTQTELALAETEHSLSNLISPVSST
jgi:hypothetical protein